MRNDRFGEFILNIPALRALRETFPHTRLIALVDPRVKEVAEMVPYIDEIIEWGSQKQALFSKISLIRRLRSKDIDMAIMLNPSRDLNIITFLAGIPLRAGYDRKCGFLLTHKIKDRKRLGQKHEVEYNLELVSLIGATTADKSISLNISDDLSESLLGERGGPLIAVHPWTSDPVKQWPTEYFSALIGRITGELGQRVVIIGGKEEAAKGLRTDKNEGNVIDLAGKTSLKQLALVLKRCRLLVSGDSGPVHLACALGIPAIAIFRNDIPGKTAGRWGPWGRGHTVIERDSLEKISPGEVFERVKQALSCAR